MRNLSLSLIIVALFVGCGKSDRNLRGETPKDPDDMVVVNGEALTRQVLERDVEVRTAEQVQQGLSGLALEEARRQATINVVDQYVKRVLLLAAAKQSGASITDAERAAAFDRIRGQVAKSGKTLEQMMAESPLGPEHMKQEVSAGLIISKYLSQRLKGEPLVSDAELNAFKKHNAGTLQRPETVRASHILMGFDKADGSDDKALKRSRIEKLREELVGGADFAVLAREHSTCPSRQRGGDLGEFPKGQMVKAFQNAAFSQPSGEIGPVIETQFGYHIILVKEHKQNAMMPDAQIRQALMKQNHQKRLVAHLEELKGEATVVYSDEVVEMMRSKSSALK